MTASERRNTQRFQMRLPLTVRWTTGAAVGETSTESRDVSSRGVYFFLSKDVKQGSAIEILLTLPNEIPLAGPVRGVDRDRDNAISPVVVTRRDDDEHGDHRVEQDQPAPATSTPGDDGPGDDDRPGACCRR